MTEIWKDIKGYEGYYQVSNHGRVRSVERIVKTRSFGKRLAESFMLKQTIGTHGYKCVTLQKYGKRKGKYVHRLIAKAFIPNPDNKPEVNHKDLDRSNNDLDNLEWMTHKENIYHSFDNGLKPVGEKNGRSKLKRNDVFQIRSIFEQGFANKEDIMGAYNISEAQVRFIISRKSWSHI